MSQQLSRFVYVVIRGSCACANTQPNMSVFNVFVIKWLIRRVRGAWFEIDCMPTERVPNRFDWVWYLVWCNVDVSVVRVWHICLNSCPKMCVNLQLKMSTNLGPSSAQAYNHVYAWYRKNDVLPFYEIFWHILFHKNASRRPVTSIHVVFLHRYY